MGTVSPREGELMGPFDDFREFVKSSEPLAPLTWFRLGGPAQYFAEPTSVDELAALVRRCHEAARRAG